MGLLDIIKGKKKSKAEEKLKRPPKGALKTPKEPKAEAEVKEKEEKAGKSALASKVLLSPHITEKTALTAERGMYVFRVSPRANKNMVKRAIEEFYGFKPVKVNVLKMPSKTRISRGRKGVKPGYKKAVVYLKEGDKIDIT